MLVNKRKNTKKIKIGDIFIGGGEKITIQSMLSKPSADIEANVLQAVELQSSGCEILRVSVPDEASLALIPAIKKRITIPLVADIHFDYRLAIKAAELGIDKIRINPGNIGGNEKVRQVVEACKKHGIPIRIGVNSGSIEKEILEKHGSPTPEAMVESAMYHVSLLEQFDFYDIIISLKSSTVKNMIEANRLLSMSTDYPIHLGVTEAGTERLGIMKASAGIGSLLLDGIGDTFRMTLTEEPVREIMASQDMLRALDLRPGVQIIACPTCGRTTIDIISLTKRVEKALENCEKDITVAVMGCVVNGPGEAREATIGIAAGGGKAVLFKKGERQGIYSEDEIFDVLLAEIEKM